MGAKESYQCFPWNKSNHFAAPMRLSSSKQQGILRGANGARLVLSKPIPLQDRRRMLTIFLGAGFGRAAGLPLAWDILDDVPAMDRYVREDLVRRVQQKWHAWRDRRGGTAEQYLASLQPRRWGSLRSDSDWQDAVKLVGLNIAVRMGQVNRGNFRGIRHHDVFRTTGIPDYEAFWDAIFERTVDVAVITTNYDILAERGIRAVPFRRGRRMRPGFHYGTRGEWLQGGSRAFSSLRGNPVLQGMVPILKLHGSVNWLSTDIGVEHHVDCWPAIHGTPALVAPVEGKSAPDWAAQTWKDARMALEQSEDWLFIGYSLPRYDEAVTDLIQRAARHRPRIHLMNPHSAVTRRFRVMFPHTPVTNYGPFPAGLGRFLRQWKPWTYFPTASSPRARISA